jgi:hypothetical protein
MDAAGYEHASAADDINSLNNFLFSYHFFFFINNHFFSLFLRLFPLIMGKELIHHG